MAVRVKYTPWSVALTAALFVGGILSLFASKFPDGLEKIASDKGFLGKGVGLIEGLFPDYAVPGISNHVLATALAGFAGTLVVFFLLYGLGKLMMMPKPGASVAEKSVNR